jgi:hypothetical protein
MSSAYRENGPLGPDGWSAHSSFPRETSRRALGAGHGFTFGEIGVRLFALLKDFAVAHLRNIYKCTADTHEVSVVHFIILLCPPPTTPT